MLATLGPFLAKPFNIDDPLFLFLGRAPDSCHPADPYGSMWNWTGGLPMWTVTENPPLACYYLAAGGGDFRLE